MENYTPCELNSKITQETEESGKIIGIYTNSKVENFFIFEKGIMLDSGKFVAFKEIYSVIYQEINSIIQIKTLSNDLLSLNIDGKNGKYLDASEFSRFLERSIEDATL